MHRSALFILLLGLLASAQLGAAGRTTPLADSATAAAAAEPAADKAASSCLDEVLDEMNQATELHKAAGTAMPDEELQAFMGAWAACGGANPYALAAAEAGAGVAEGGGRRLLAANPRCYKSPLSCYRNSLTNGNVLCNWWCGLFSYCDARPGKWGRCRYAG